MIFVRDPGGVITFWNRTAEQTCGWSAEDALGRLADELLQTRYPDSRETIEASLLDTGRWEGRIEQRTKAGIPLTVDARWALQHDHHRRQSGHAGDGRSKRLFGLRRE
ncbi:MULTISPECIES: PAS domain-containing protein [unclassified Bradyrhizobium]|uniref:PAS domain-containing protein n=1 Tax=unclassified Bradyrhizobium TaxID=2631580 RepID=UPI0028F122B8|nr:MULTISPECIES: PAS domain-containing protein [unclassified Bradyrhizobium]